MKYGTAEYSLNEAKKQIDKALENLSTVRNEVGTIMEIKGLGAGISSELARYYKGTSYSSFDPKYRNQVDSAYAAGKAAVAERLAQIESIHKENIPAIENNLATRKKISDFMGAVGITASYSVYELPSPKHRNKQSVTKSAGYISDVNRMIPTSDGYDAAKRSLIDSEARLTKEYQTLIANIEKAEKEETHKAKAKEDLMELARMQVKYGNLEWDELLDVILEKDKYLRLGHYLLKNREDWNDGYSYAECGLNSFVVETEEDKEIESEIESVMGENWDGDGRLFRDLPNYSYGYLFSKVNADLYKDYELIKSKTSDY
jgi:hypothetical protein